MKIYCAHTNKEYREGNDCNIYTCKLCGEEWSSFDDTPKIVIGYTDDSEKVTAARAI